MYKYTFYFLITIFYASSFLAQIRLILTAALTTAHSNFRRAQYIKSFQKLLEFGYVPNSFYIVESLKKHGPTFLNDYCTYVFYATTNNPTLKNHGINEAITLLEAVNHFNFKPEEMIIKLTGRHHFINDSFIRTVQNNLDYDAIVRVDGEGNVFTICFAMKCKHLVEMIKNFNIHDMEKKWILFEYAAKHYLNKKLKEGNFKVLYVDKLNIFVNTFGSSTAPTAPETHWIY